MFVEHFRAWKLEDYHVLALICLFGRLRPPLTCPTTFPTSPNALSLIFLPSVRHEIQLRPRSGFEFGRTILAGEVVANPHRIAIQCVDRGEGLALVWAFGPDDGDAFGIR